VHAAPQRPLNQSNEPMKYADLFRLDGKTALITGSSKGIGRAIAEAMAAQGAQVVISSRKLEACEKVAEAINADGGRAVAIPCNISHKEQLQQLVAGARQAFGRIDILICNAAVNPHYGPLTTLSDDAYEKTMGANVRSNLWLCNMVMPEMAERKDGAVIIVSSVAGLKGTDKIGIYAISKAADMQLARNLAVEWGRSNVRANCLAPAIIKTDMARALWDNPDTYRHAVSTYPLGRIGDVSEVAGAAVFLAAPAGRFITGQTIVIDGGSSIVSGM
jgi:NAD(P)-dependent dehydrogenase (short-subunit alcohol dehydrogenase family)